MDKYWCPHKYCLVRGHPCKIRPKKSAAAYAAKVWQMKVLRLIVLIKRMHAKVKELVYMSCFISYGNPLLFVRVAKNYMIILKWRFSPARMLWHLTTILELAEDQRKKKYFQKWNLTIGSCLYKNQIYKTLLIYKKGHQRLRPWSSFLFLPTEFQSVTSAKNRHETKTNWWILAVIHVGNTSFATVISVTKRQSKLSNY
jgi:hypothetical protein